jgi:hypothetical protein
MVDKFENMNKLYEEELIMSDVNHKVYLDKYAIEHDGYTRGDSDSDLCHYYVWHEYNGNYFIDVWYREEWYYDDAENLEKYDITNSYLVTEDFFHKTIEEFDNNCKKLTYLKHSDLKNYLRKNENVKELYNYIDNKFSKDIYNIEK